jgi:hypothetical protein
VDISYNPTKHLSIVPIIVTPIGSHSHVYNCQHSVFYLKCSHRNGDNNMTR